MATVEKPERPSIPVTLVAFAGLVSAEQFVLRFLPFIKVQALLEDIPEALCLVLLTGVASVFGLVAWLIWRGGCGHEERARGQAFGRRRYVAFVVGLGIGFVCVGWLVYRSAQAVKALSSSSASTWELEVLSDATEVRYGWRCRARACRVAAGGGATAGSGVAAGGGAAAGTGNTGVAADAGGAGASGFAVADGADGTSSLVVWLSLDEPVSYGEKLQVIGRFEALDDGAWGRSCRSQGVWGQVRVRSIRARGDPTGVLGVAYRLRKAALAAIDPQQSDARALLAGCVCGERTELRARGLDDVFAACGAAHLVAVSGGHLAVVAAMVGALTLQLNLMPIWRNLIVAVVSGGFVLCCGMPASALRAWIMALVGETGGFVGRSAHRLSSVALAACAMAVAEPGVSGQLAFQLSVVSVVALDLMAAYGRYFLATLRPSGLVWLERRFAWRMFQLPYLSEDSQAKLAGQPGAFRAALAVGLVCQMASLPLSLPAFGRLSLVGPLAGALAGMVFTPFVSLGSVVALLAGVPALQWCCAPLLTGCDVFATVLLSMLRALATLPLASVAFETDGVLPVVLGFLALVALVGLYLLWPDVRGRPLRVCFGTVLACALVWTLRWRYFAPARVVVLDVGQGDAILVQDGAAAVLVDTGPEGVLAAALARNHVMHLDAVVLSHLHNDHYGGVGELAGTTRVDALYVGEGAADNLPADLAMATEQVLGSSEEVEELGYGDELWVGHFCLRVVWPHEPRDGDENADSLELAVSYNARGQTLTALLTGDAECEQTGSVLAAGDVGDIDFLKVGHHGSAVSLTEDEACALAAEVAVASAGEGNSYGHPSEECQEMLLEAGSWFICTMWAGDVSVEPGASGPVVHTQHASGGG